MAMLYKAEYTLLCFCSGGSCSDFRVELWHIQGLFEKKLPIITQFSNGLEMALSIWQIRYYCITGCSLRYDRK